MGASASPSTPEGPTEPLEGPNEATIKPCFEGFATVSLDAIPIPDSVRNGDPSKGFAAFMASPDSNMALLGAGEHGISGNISKLDSAEGNDSDDIWECQQESVQWFGLTISPAIACSIGKDKIEQNTVNVSILGSKTNVTGLGVLGRSVASMIEKATTDGMTEYVWEEDLINGVYNLRVSFMLNIRVKSYMPGSVKSVGSKFVTKTCNKELNENVQNVVRAYIEWCKKQ